MSYYFAARSKGTGVNTLAIGPSETICVRRRRAKIHVPTYVWKNLSKRDRIGGDNDRQNEQNAYT